MTRLALRLTVLLAAGFALVISSARVLSQQTFDVANFQRLFRTSGACTSPCLMGIRPGMNLSDALAVLRHHDWVTNLTLSTSIEPDVAVAWDWNGQQPAFIDRESPGRMLARADRSDSNHVVITVTVETTLRLPDVVYGLGAASGGSAAYIPQDKRIRYEVSYYDAGAAIRTALSTRWPCPARLIDSFWTPHTQVFQRADAPTNDYVPPQALPALCRSARAAR